MSKREARGKPGPWRKPFTAVVDEPPRIEVPDDWEPGKELIHRPTVKNWRRLGGIMTGVIDGDIETLPGVIAKLSVRGGYVLMDDGEIYQLGLRAYAGT